MPTLIPKPVREAAEHTSPRPAALPATNDALTGAGRYHYARSPVQRRAAPTSSTTATTGYAAPPLGGGRGTGLPAHLQSGMQALSGLSLDAVRVHYNSPRPAQVDALAYAQGNDIHLAPGQEKNLPHEAWHVVQQAQGRARPTMQLGNGVSLNDDAGLEREADVMGSRALASAARPGAATTVDTPRHAGTSPGPTLQRRRIVHASKHSVVGIDTEALTIEQLERWLASGSLSPANQLELMRAIDAGEVKGGIPHAYDYAERQLGFLRAGLPETLDEINEFSWVKRITGGGSGSLTGKRNAHGIRTDMAEAEYEATDELTRGFYNTANQLNVDMPRDKPLTLYRGFTVPAIEGDHPEEQLAEKIRGFSDVLPSSSSWQREQAIGMSNPGQDESAVLLYMNISPGLPIVIMSYPSNKNPPGKPAPLDIAQAEVLVAASTNEDVHVFRIEQLDSGRLRYHVAVTLVARDRDQILDGIETARTTAASERASKRESRDVEFADLKTVFGAEIGQVLIESPQENSTYQDLNGDRWVLQIADRHFGYTFEKVLAPV